MTGTVRVFSFCRSSLSTAMPSWSPGSISPAAPHPGLICRRSAKKASPRQWGFASYPAACKYGQIRHRDRLFVFHNRNQCHVCFTPSRILYSLNVQGIPRGKQEKIPFKRSWGMGREGGTEPKGSVPPSTSEGQGGAYPLLQPLRGCGKGAPFFLLDGLPDLGLCSSLPAGASGAQIDAPLADVGGVIGDALKYGYKTTYPPPGAPSAFSR